MAYFHFLAFEESGMLESDEVFSCNVLFMRVMNFICAKFVVSTATTIAVITVEPADKISFVYNCMQPRLRGQYNGK